MATEYDSSTPLNDLKSKVQKFVTDRKWQRYHNPKDLAVAISVESSELLDIFKWTNALNDFNKISTKTRKAIAEEMADVLIYLLCMSNAMSIDLTQATLKKIAKNARKYPKERPTRW